MHRWQVPSQLPKSERDILQKLPLTLHNPQETIGAENLKISGKLYRCKFSEEACLRDALKLPAERQYIARSSSCNPSGSLT